MLIVTALLGLGAASAAARYLVAAGAPRRVAAAAILTSRRIAAFGSLGSCGLGLLLVLAYLLAGAGATTITLPLGLPGLGIPGPGIPGPGIAGGGLIDGSLYDGSLTLALDGLSGFFLLLLMAAGAAASVAALDGPGDYDATAPCLPVFLAAMALTLLAGDAFALMLGFELMSLASFALVLTRHEDATVRSAALQCIGMAAVGAACLIPALALLADGAGWDLRFAAIRALPPEGWRATLVLVLALVGAGSRAGLAPLHVWLPPAHVAAPAHVSALLSGAMTKVALYVLMRVLFDLCGPAQPVWWGVPLLVLGAGGAVLGGLRANMENDIKALLACSTVANIGLIVIGLGVALAARGADLSTLAALALGGALLHALAHGLYKSLLFIAAGAVQHGAGTRLLVRLGGLIHRMPVTTACVLVGGGVAGRAAAQRRLRGHMDVVPGRAGGARASAGWGCRS